MLDRLFAYLHRPDHPDDTFVRLESLALQHQELKFVLRVLDYREHVTWGRWEVLARRPHDFRVEEPNGEPQLHEHGHVLARQFTDKHQSLYFRAAPASAPEVVGLLRAAHHRVSGDWIAFGRYLNPRKEFGALIAAGNGLLADGPMFLIHEYAGVLEGAGMKPSALDPRQVRRYYGGPPVSAPAPLATLVLGRSWFVAEEFEERELPDA